MGDADGGFSQWRRRLSCLAVLVAVLAGGTGGFLWLFQDELFHPFGDARACEGSDARLPDVISAGGVPIPADASDIHYVTENGSARVSFLSSQMPDYLHRAGLVPEGKPLLEYDEKYALGDGESELPEGLCGPAVTGPVWSHELAGPRPGGSILVERSSVVPGALRAPARVIATFNIR
ncbi:hypothetical protein [Streptomyces carpinensis]|uniref:Secreted protein n=1 Tax=Streptomyces carpinensis TaxID=66369 RepID=A0ABV1W3K1_9ACTN|nr:hypothetical protein [Streptomyces carpinensis]